MNKETQLNSRQHWLLLKYFKKISKQDSIETSFYRFKVPWLLVRSLKNNYELKQLVIWICFRLKNLPKIFIIYVKITVLIVHKWIPFLIYFLIYSISANWVIIFCFISRINLRSKILSFLHRSHEISTFVWEKPNTIPTQRSIHFSSVLIQIKITVTWNSQFFSVFSWKEIIQQIYLYVSISSDCIL